MEISFDPAKREKTLRERKLDFGRAAEVFAGLTFTQRDERRDYGEIRYQTYGLLDGRLIMMVWTYRFDSRRHLDEEMQWARKSRVHGALGSILTTRAPGRKISGTAPRSRSAAWSSARRAAR
jgi:uncharacterized DUF497 family protein